MPSMNLSLLGNAISNQEGYGQPGAVPTRCNNPGDLKVGDVGNGLGPNGETVFDDAGTGQAALNNQLNLIATGTSPVYNAYAQSLGLDDSSQLTLAQVGAKYAEDPNWANGVATQLGVDPNGPSMGDIANGSVTLNKVGAAPLATTNPPGSPVTIQTDNNEPTKTAVGYQPLPNNDVSNGDYSALTPNVVILQGLDELPWYQDQGMIAGANRLRNKVVPISFTVVLNDNNGPFVLSSKGRTGTPVQIQLECNLHDNNVAMKHVMSKKPSRTGFHITLWGMQADIIEGRGTTGVMMNQLGLTDFMSVSNATQDLIRLVQSGFQFSQTDYGQSNPAFNDSGIALNTSPDVFTQTVQNQTNGLPSSFRVAAQDAFQELLSLFKMNGVVWFPGGDPKNTQPNSNTTGISAWSPQLGASSQQVHGRNNDVMTRGSVIFKMDGTTYQGYFKSFSWTQDAKDPFQWHFNFTFQVERTSTLLYYPASGNTPNPAITALPS